MAKPEKLPRFSFSHSLLLLVNDTQPGSAEKPEAKTLAEYNHQMLATIYQMESERLPLPDESFLERNGLMK